MPSFNPDRVSECRPTYYLDGARIQLDNFPLGLDQIRPDEIEAVEVYTSSSQIPARWSGSNSQCGVVVMWTRSR